jgi:Ca2+-transporting ATPase
MKLLPRDPREGVLVTRDRQAIVAYSIIITLSIFSVFFYCRGYLFLDSMACNNVDFIALALAQLWHIFNLPSAEVSFFKMKLQQAGTYGVACSSVYLSW